MATAIDETFPRDYEVEPAEVPAPGGDRLVMPAGVEASATFYFPADIEAELDRVATVGLRVTPRRGSAWVGAFLRGFESPHVAEGLFTTPARNKLCVVAGGFGYIVHSDAPKLYDRVIAQPVREVCAVPAHRLLLFVDFTNIVAYGAEGVAWRTERLSWDGIRVTHIGDERVHGFAWDQPSDREVEFEVDLRTGEHTGGAAP